jgi:hypothetical protein
MVGQNRRTSVALERSESEQSAATTIQAHYRGYKVRQGMGSRTETMKILEGDFESSRSLTSQFSRMKKNRSGRYSIPWLYIIAANAILVDIMLAWMFMNVPDTSSNGIDGHRVLGHRSDKFIGFMVLGANRNSLQKSMDQRIEQAFDKWIETCNRPGYQGVFFPTGNNHSARNPPEASYIADELRRMYSEKRSQYRHLQAPIIREEGNALFTVDNFLKTIPKVGDFQRENGKFEVVYLVTNEYHMGRSLAIVKQFEKQALVDFTLERCDVPRSVCRGDDRDASLDEIKPNGRTFEQNIRENTDRDIENSQSFARAIFMKSHSKAFDGLLEDAYLCDKYKYAKANCGGDENWAANSQMNGKLKQFDNLVGAFEDLYSASHECGRKCKKLRAAIWEDKHDIRELLGELNAERGRASMSFCSVFS